MKATVSLRQEHRESSNVTPILRKEWVFILISWFIASMLLIGVSQTRLFLSRDKALRYNEGDLVTDDFYIENNFSFVDLDATLRAVNLKRSLVSPVYTVSIDITESVLKHYDRFFSLLKPAKANGSSSEAAAELRVEFPGAASLIDSDSSRTVDELTRLLQLTRDALESLEYGGIFRLDTGDEESASGVIEVVYNEAQPDRRVSLIRSTVTLTENLPEKVRAMDELSGLAPGDAEFVTALVSYFAEPNGYLNTILSEKSRDETEAATKPVSISITAGTRLLSSGRVVTAQQARILDALRLQRNVGYHSYIDPLLYMAFLFALGLVVARSFDITLRNQKTFWLYVALSGSYLLIAALVTVFFRFQENLSVSVVLPTALFTLLLAQLLQDRRLAVLSSILMSLLIYFLTPGSSYDFLITLSAGIGGTLSVKKRESRMGLLRAGPRLAIILSVTTLLTGLLVRKPLNNVLIMAVWSAANGMITGILSLAFLPLMEHVLNTATTFRLIELSDQNVPILKRMRLQAPGTYIHSQNVAHLAEAACDAIGADGLLARVGAYYHDIGKVDQARFFVENQKGENKHDELKASLSVAVIKSHVKIGIEKGRELRLPDEVLAVIEQHHGTSVIRYFYDRALKEKGGESTSPDDFSYGGPKPMSREAAVVMLADNAEAATRTLKKPTAAKLEKYIWDLIMDRFRTGELNESDLTLRDLETIKLTFAHVLTGHFHTRIEYPKEIVK